MLEISEPKKFKTEGPPPRSFWTGQLVFLGVLEWVLHKKRWIEFARVAVLPIIYLLLVVAEHSGVIDHWRGLDRVKDIAANFNLSCAPDASKPVYPTDPAWHSLIGLIHKYSKAQLRTDKQPQTVARFVATLSTQQPVRGAHFSEWTAPSTPIVLFYRHWPENTGKSIPPEDFTIVGTIGDLQNWIELSTSLGCVSPSRGKNRHVVFPAAANSAGST
jgi:hypothetical protein